MVLRLKKNIYIYILPMSKIEDSNGADYTARDCDHDAGEIGT